jgi:hypothetical protein
MMQFHPKSRQGLQILPMIIALICPALSFAEPARISELSPPKPGPHPPIPSCTVNLRVSWKGLLDSGLMRVEFQPRGASKPGKISIRSEVESTGAAAKLFPYKSHAWSEIDPTTLKPLFFQSTETDRSETITTTLRHTPISVNCEEKSRDHKSGKLSESRKNFTHQPVYDLFSAMLFIRSQNLREGDSYKLLIYPFKQPYLLHVTVRGRENHLQQKSIRLGVDLRKINAKTLELMPYKKLKREATLWLSDDIARVPLELRAAVFVGDVRATRVGT